MTISKKAMFSNISLLYTAAVWGSSFFLIKDTVADMNPFILIGYRFTLAAIMLGAFLIFRKKLLVAHLTSGIVLGMLMWVAVVSQTIGLEYTSATNSAFITGLMLCFVPLFSYLFFRKRTTGVKLISILIVICGLYFLLGGIQAINKGDFITLVTAISYALYVIFAGKYATGKHDTLVLNFQQLLFIGLASLVTGIVTRAPLTIHGLANIASIIYLSLFASLSAFIAQLLAQKYVPPTTASLLLSTEPLFAALFNWTIGGEQFIPLKAFGGLLMFFAIILSELPLDALLRRRASRSVPLSPQAPGAFIQIDRCLCGHLYHTGALFCGHCGNPRETSIWQICDIASIPTAPLLK